MGTAALVLLAGCSGGGGGSTAPAPQSANQLVYTDPAASGWRFVKVSGTGSFTEPLILELRGPAGSPIQGAACYLDLGSSPKVAWHALSGPSYVDALTNPNMGLGSEVIPRIVKDKLTLNELQVGAFKKGGSADPNGGVFRVALRVAGDAQVPGDVPVVVKNTKVLDATGNTTTPAFVIGTLRAEQ
jgi:hypothetical protein